MIEPLPETTSTAIRAVYPTLGLKLAGLLARLGEIDEMRLYTADRQILKEAIALALEARAQAAASYREIEVRRGGWSVYSAACSGRKQ